MWSNKEEAACAKSQGQTHLNANSNNRSARRTCGLTTTYKWNHLPPPYSQSRWIVYRNALTMCSKLANCLDELTVQLPNIKKWYSCKRDNKRWLNSDKCNLEFTKEASVEKKTPTTAVLTFLYFTWLLIDGRGQQTAFIDKWFFRPGTTQ